MADNPIRFPARVTAPPANLETSKRFETVPAIETSAVAKAFTTREGLLPNRSPVNAAPPEVALGIAIPMIEKAIILAGAAYIAWHASQSAAPDSVSRADIDEANQILSQAGLPAGDDALAMRLLQLESPSQAEVERVIAAHLRESGIKSHFPNDLWNSSASLEAFDYLGPERLLRASLPYLENLAGSRGESEFLAVLTAFEQADGRSYGLLSTALSTLRAMPADSDRSKLTGNVISMLEAAFRSSRVGGLSIETADSLADAILAAFPDGAGPNRRWLTERLTILWSEDAARFTEIAVTAAAALAVSGPAVMGAHADDHPDERYLKEFQDRLKKQLKELKEQVRTGAKPRDELLDDIDDAIDRLGRYRELLRDTALEADLRTQEANFEMERARRDRDRAINEDPVQLDRLNREYLERRADWVGAQTLGFAAEERRYRLFKQIQELLKLRNQLE